MKIINTTNRHGVASASDNDGHQCRINSTELTYDKGHSEAARALCEKMGWSGELIGSYRLQAGRTIGMAWLWVDPGNPRIMV